MNPIASAVIDGNKRVESILIKGKLPYKKGRITFKRSSVEGSRCFDRSPWQNGFIKKLETHMMIDGYLYIIKASPPTTLDKFDVLQLSQ